MINIFAIGAGGLGKELCHVFYYSSLFGSNLVFVDEDKNKIGNIMRGNKILSLDEIREPSPTRKSFYTVAMGDVSPRIKFQKYMEENHPSISPISIYNNKAIGPSHSKVGLGSIMFPNVCLTYDVTIGNFCVLYQNVSLNHDCKVGDFTTLCPGVTVAANTHIGKRCYIGVGSTISNMVKICDDVALGANTGVVKNITEPGLYVGTPARRIK